MEDSLTLQTSADACLDEQVRASLLQNTRPDPVFHIVAAAVLEYDGLDSLELEQPGKREPRWARADDADLRPLLPHSASPARAEAQNGNG
jgi:hypothetical protein